MRIALALLCLLVVVVPVWAQTEAEGDDEILLQDGTVLTGRIVAETESAVTLATSSLGEVVIERENIQSVHRAGEAHGIRVDPDANSILLTPTPETIAKGDFYFRSFELFILNAGYGLTDDLNLSIGGLFPVSGSWNFLALGLKQRVLDRDEKSFGLALTGSLILLPDDQRFYSLGAVAGVGDARRSLNLAYDQGYNEDGDSGGRVMIGGDFQLSRRTKLFAEWMDSALVFEEDDGDDEFHGFVTVGFRLFGESMAFTLGGIRPLVDSDTGDFIAFPMLMFSAHW